MVLPEAQLPPGVQDAGGIRWLPGKDPRLNDANRFNVWSIRNAPMGSVEIQNLSTNGHIFTALKPQTMNLNQHLL